MGRFLSLIPQRSLFGTPPPHPPQFFIANSVRELHHSHAHNQGIKRTASHRGGGVKRGGNRTGEVTASLVEFHMGWGVGGGGFLVSDFDPPSPHDSDRFWGVWSKQ